MKPTLLFYEKTKDGKIVLSEDEVRKILKEVYEQGFEDGKKTRDMLQIFENERCKKAEIPKFNIPKNLPLLKYDRKD